MKNLIKILIILLASVLFSCGGGGSDDDAPDGKYGVRVLHGAIETFPVSLFELTDSGEQNFLQTNRFGSRSGFTTLEKGDRILTLRPNNSNTLLQRTSVKIEDKDRWNLLVYGDRSEFGFRTSLFKEKPLQEELSSGEVGLNLVHSIIGASQVTLSLVSEGASRPTDTGLGASFGGHTDFVKLAAGTYTIIANRVADRREVARVSNFTLREGETYTALVTGEVGLFTQIVIY